MTETLRSDGFPVDNWAFPLAGSRNPILTHSAQWTEPRRVEESSGNQQNIRREDNPIPLDASVCELCHALSQQALQLSSTKMYL